MTDTDPIASPNATPDSLSYDLIDALLEGELILEFTKSTGVLSRASDSARAVLDTGPDDQDAPGFDAVIGAEEEEAADVWWEVSSGARTVWDGIVNGPAGIAIPMRLRAAVTGDDATVVVMAVPVTGVAPEMTQDAPIDPMAVAPTDALSETDDLSDPFEGATEFDTPDDFSAAPNDAGGDDPMAGAWESIHDSLGIIVFNNDGVVQAHNERAEMALEVFGEDLVGRHQDSLWPTEKAQSGEFVEFWDKLRAGRIIEGRHEHVTATESRVWLQSTFLPVRDESGYVIKIIQCLMDVTDATLLAQDSQAKIDALSNAMAISEFDAEGHLITLNDNMQAI